MKVELCLHIRLYTISDGSFFLFFYGNSGGLLDQVTNTPYGSMSPIHTL